MGNPQKRLLIISINKHCIVHSCLPTKYIKTATSKGGKFQRSVIAICVCGRFDYGLLNAPNRFFESLSYYDSDVVDNID